MARKIDYIGLSPKEHAIIYSIEPKPIQGNDVLLIGYDAKVEEIQSRSLFLYGEVYKKIYLLYSGSSEVSKYLDTNKIKYERIPRYCDDAVITHQLHHVLNFLQGSRDINSVKIVSWGNGAIAKRFNELFPHFNYSAIDPNSDYIKALSEEQMSSILHNAEVILVNHSHNKFKSKWLKGNINSSQDGNINSTIIINSSRANAIDFSEMDESKFPFFYSDVDKGCPHNFFETVDTYENIKNFVREVITNEDN